MGKRIWILGAMATLGVLMSICGIFGMLSDIDSAGKLKGNLGNTAVVTYHQMAVIYNGFCAVFGAIITATMIVTEAIYRTLDKLQEVRNALEKGVVIETAKEKVASVSAAKKQMPPPPGTRAKVQVQPVYPENPPWASTESESGLR